MPAIDGLDKKIATFLTTLVPPGSGSDARRAVMEALADVQGMYLAGDLAKEGRRAYLHRAQELQDRTSGVAETSAVQLRKNHLVGFPAVQPRAFSSPPDDMEDYQGKKGLLLSSMGATIDTEHLGTWLLPGWPRARAVVTGTGIEIHQEPDVGASVGETWEVRLLEREVKTHG